MKKTILAMLLALPMTMFAQKIGHVNFETVIQGMSEYTAAQTEFQNLQKQLSEEMQRKQTEFQTKSEAYEKEKATLSETLRTYREQELQKAPDIDNCYLFIMGQVGRMYFQKRKRDEKKASVDGEFLYTTQNPTLYRAGEIAEMVIEKFESGDLDEVYLIYTDMVTSNQQETRTLRLLPFERKHFGKAEDGTMKKLPKASFMPSPEEVMNYLIPQYAKGIIYGAMVEAFCCEQQSRMTAMDAATNSAKDMIKDLSLMYNRARQAAITQEITEVCGGAASLDE